MNNNIKNPNIMQKEWALYINMQYTISQKEIFSKQTKFNIDYEGKMFLVYYKERIV